MGTHTLYGDFIVIAYKKRLYLIIKYGCSLKIPK